MAAAAPSNELGIKGWTALERGEAACLLVAGGQGSRLGFEAPKGCYPLSVVRRKSLFQLFCERCLAASNAAGVALRLAIMCGPKDLQQLSDYFEKHRYFNLDRDQVTLFAQSTLPVLNEQGQAVAEAPSGNGWALKHLYESDAWESWQEAGVKSVVYCHIDNPLLDPFDVELIGYHLKEGADVTIKSVLREDPQESVGILIPTNGSWRVIEYSEVDAQLRQDRDSQGKLRYPYANISAFCFASDFIENTSVGAAIDMPVHRAAKRIPGLEARGQLWKQERFIFDLLPFAQRCKVFTCDRSRCFAPLKSANGPGSPEQVREAMQHEDARVFQELTGQLAPSPLELDPGFYYVRNKQALKWSNNAGYVSLSDS